MIQGTGWVGARIQDIGCRQLYRVAANDTGYRMKIMKDTGYRM